MKSLLTIISLLFSISSYSGVFSDLDLDNSISEPARVEVYVGTYDSLNRGKIINQLKRSHSNCGEAFVEVGRENAISELEDFYGEDELGQTLRELNKANKIAFSVLTRDGDEGYVEYCSTATIEFYSVDGELLQLYFDYNT